ncbi:hypothetical protein Tco_0931237 [Tanacetum coccineum]
MHTECGDGVASIKRCRRDLQSDGVKNFVTASERSRLKEDLESLTWRRRSIRTKSGTGSGLLVVPKRTGSGLQFNYKFPAVYTVSWFGTKMQAVFWCSFRQSEDPKAVCQLIFASGLLEFWQRTSKDNEDPSWSTSFKTRRTQKTSSALERGEERRDEKKRLDHLKQDQAILVIKRFIERKKPGIPNGQQVAVSAVPDISGGRLAT